MSHYNVKLDLSKLKHVVREIPKQGGGTTKVVIIDGPSNHLFFGEKGGIYLDLIAFENKEIKYDNTHSIKQSFPKDIRDKMTEEQKKNAPFIGNMRPTGTESQAPEAPTSDAFGEMPSFDDGFKSSPESNSATDSKDDLPF